MEFYITRSSGTKKNDEENELKHYGIKGQQWGKRNYQYEDGSLTPEGKRRYADNKSIRANMLTSQTQTWTAKRADQIDSSTLDKLKEKLAKNKAREDLAEKRKAEERANQLSEYVDRAVANGELPFNSADEAKNTPEYKVVDKMMRLNLIKKNYYAAAIYFNGEPFVGTENDIKRLLMDAAENGSNLNDVSVIGIYKTEDEHNVSADRDIANYMQKHRVANK